MRARVIILFVALSLLYTAPGMLPGRRLVPLDIPNDYLAWKHDPAVRVRVSNSLLSDVPLQLVPWDTEARRLLARGEMPWRNRYTGDSEHLFANPLAAQLSPFTWPRLMFGLRGWAWTVALKLLVAALSMFWLARALRLSEIVSFISAIVFALCGFAITLSLYPQTNVFVLLPAFCAAALSKRPLPIAVAAALATAGGHPETLFVGVVSIIAFVWWNSEPRRIPLASLASAFAGFLLLAIQIVPFVILMWSSYARVGRLAALPEHFRALSVASLALPGILGSPLRGELDLTGAIPNAENFSARASGYIGAIALLAIIIAFRELPQALRRGVLLGAAGLSLSWWIPGVRDVMRVVPVVKWLAFDYLVVAWAVFASLASGAALIIVADGKVRKLLGALIIAAGLALIVGGVLPSVAPGLLERFARAGIERLQRSGLLHQAPQVYEQRLAFYLAAAKWTAIRRVAIPGFCVAVFGAALLMTASNLRRAAMIAAWLVELIAFGYGYAPAIGTEEIAPVPEAVTAIRTVDPAAQWFVASGPEVLPANLGTLYAIRDVAAYDVLTSAEETLRLKRAGYDPFLHTFPIHPKREQFAEMASMGVRFWISEREIVEIPNARQPPPAVNAPPRGIRIGAALSLAGLILLIVCMRSPLRT